MKKSLLLLILLCLQSLVVSAQEAAPPVAPKDSARKPVILILRPPITDSPLAEAWDKGLGKAHDQISTAPGAPNDFSRMTPRKVGIHAWMFTKLSDLEKNAAATAKANPGIRWVWYDLEGGAEFSTAKEYKNPLASVKKAREICTAHGWKLGLIPDAGVGMNQAVAVKLAPHLDAFVVQSQKKQTPKQVAYLRGLAGAMKEVNPGCLVGAQLGVGVPEKGYGPPEKAVNFYLQTRDFLDIYSVWWGTPESMVALLRALDATGK